MATPGSVVVVRVTTPSAARVAPLAHVQASVFDRTIPLWAADEPLTWEGLIGIDVETTPGRYAVIVEGRPAATVGASSDAADTTAAAGEVTLVVTPRTFGARKLRVDPRFSEPPASVRARIEREARLLATIFSTTSEDRHWTPPFDRPVSETMNSPFGLRSIFNGVTRGRHNGVDFASPRGTPIHAPAAGRIVLVDSLYYTGDTVVIDHGHGLYSLMAHLERTAVETGALVARGDAIGYVGNSGRTTGPHLHWTVRLQGARVDPLSVVAISTPVPPSPARARTRR